MLIIHVLQSTLFLLLCFFPSPTKPGVGKSTLVRRVIDELLSPSSSTSSLTWSGFFTEEVRQNEERIGFDITSINSSQTGKHGVLARVENMANFRGNS